MQEHTWLRMELLGQGAYGRVYRMQDVKTGKIYAGKFSGSKSMPEKGDVSREAKKILNELMYASKKLEEEIEIHRKLVHPNIVKYIDSFHTNHCYEEKEVVVGSDHGAGACSALILEYCPNGSLYDMFKIRGKLLEKEARYIIYQLAKALRYLKSQNVIHLDIKEENIMLGANMEILLGDFGFAIYYPGTSDKGTPIFIAPEVLEGEPRFESDVWSLGVLLYELLLGWEPFKTIKHSKRGEYMKEDVEKLWETAQDVLKRIFVVDPEDRITIEELLEHPFFTAEGPPIKRLPHESRAIIPSDDLFEYSSD